MSPAHVPEVIAVSATDLPSKFGAASTQVRGAFLLTLTIDLRAKCRRSQPYGFCDLDQQRTRRRVRVPVTLARTLKTVRNRKPLLILPLTLTLALTKSHWSRHPDP